MLVCKGWSAKLGIALCSGQKPGQPCSNNADKCDPKDSCDAVLICTDVDPTTVGCGKSSRRFKREIRSRDGDGRCRMGFVIEDQPGSSTIDARGEPFDLCGDASMPAAALQSQAVRIEQLECQLEAARSQDSWARQRQR